MSDRRWIPLKLALKKFGVSERTLKRWKRCWTPGAEYCVSPTGGHLYDPELIENWLVFGQSNPDLHQKAVESALNNLPSFRAKAPRHKAITAA